ncbi:TPA: hypothetical protein EYQ19_00300 [Candidatus Pacearchaeota archaeon]|jgi:5'(3')-deoxyribonucleotidase|nr:hypothetical protein [Candidatus Pacearchaeota archaeon]
MRIGIDLDEILAEWMNSFIDFHNINYGTNLERKDFYTFDLWKPLDIKRGEERERINNFSKSDFYRNISPVEGSIEGIDNLQNNELFIVTGRKNKNKSATLDWIDKYFPNKFEDVLFSDYCSIKNNIDKKAEICSNLGIGFMIEDNGEWAHKCASSGIRTFLLDKEWNRGYSHPFLKRNYSWKEVVSNINEYS